MEQRKDKIDDKDDKFDIDENKFDVGDWVKIISAPVKVLEGAYATVSFSGFCPPHCYKIDFDMQTYTWREDQLKGVTDESEIEDVEIERWPNHYLSIAKFWIQLGKFNYNHNFPDIHCRYIGKVINKFCDYVKEQYIEEVAPKHTMMMKSKDKYVLAEQMLNAIEINSKKKK